MPLIARNMKPSGNLGLLLMRRDPFNGRQAAHPLNLIRHALPRPGLPREVNIWRLKNLPNAFRGVWRIWLAEVLGLRSQYGAVFHRVNHGGIALENGEIFGGVWVEYGLASLRVVTDAGVAYLAACMDNTSEPENLKFHGFGTGTNAEATTDTTLQTELTTQYATDNVRPTGSQAHAGGVGSATYTTVATLSPDSGANPLAITEHGLLSQASNAGGTLWDRSKFAAVNLVPAADSLQTTYVLTYTSGG